MPRPEKPIDPVSGPIAEFAHALRDLRAQVGSPPYKAMAKRVHYSVGALSQAASGARLPTWEVTRAYVRACGGPEDEWQQRWRQAAAAMTSTPDSLVRPKIRTTQRGGGVAHAPVSGRARSSPAGDVLPSGMPEPHRAATLPELVAMLNQLRAYAGLSLRELAIRSRSEPSIARYPVILARSTLSPVLRGDGRALRFEEMLRIVEICGGGPEALGAWSTAWSRLVPSRDQMLPITQDAAGRTDTAARERFNALREAQKAARSSRPRAGSVRRAQRRLAWLVAALAILILAASVAFGLVIS
jgi:transcriptional regulator with XRE-family HTH domain